MNPTSAERRELERLERGHTTVQHVTKRACIVLRANEEGMRDQEIATRLETTKGRGTQWTKRCRA